MKCDLCHKDCSKIYICEECSSSFCSSCGNSEAERCSSCLMHKETQKDNEIIDS